MKRVVSAFLLVVVILGLLPIQAGAISTGTTPGGVKYFVSDTVSFPRYKDRFGFWAGPEIQSDYMGDGYWVAYILDDVIICYPVSVDSLENSLVSLDAGKDTHGIYAGTNVGYIGFEKNRGDIESSACAGLLQVLYEAYTYAYPEYLSNTPYENMKARNSKDVYVYYTTADNAGNPDQPPAELSVSMEGVTGQTWIMDSAVKSGKVLGVNQEPWESGSLEQLFPDTLSDADKNKLVFPWFMGLAGNLSFPGPDDDDWASVLKTEPEKEQEALEDAAESLGDYPSTGSFFEQAEWSARYYILQKQKGVETPDMNGFVTLDAVNSASEDQFGETHAALKKAYVQSIFTMLDTSPFKAGDKVAGPTEGGRLIDSATALSALRTYLNLDQTGQLDTSEQRMLAWKYKLQATMGLASGTLRVAVGDETVTALTKDELNSFIEVAYGSALAKDINKIYGRVGYPRSTTHIGEEVLSSYYYYLVLCYQEYGYYATTLVNNLGPLIAQQQTSFSQRGSDIAALKSIYDALSWANDDALWDFWDSKNSEATFDGDEYKSLKAIYDYLLSVNAFDGISEYDPESVDSPLRYFFGDAETGGGGKSFSLSEDVKTGILASASFLPMKTNLYDPYTYSDIVDTEWLLNFHSKFGYNRKALYIDTNVDSAVNFQRTGTRGELKVCTLEDLLYADKDIVLYLDDNLYNVKELAELTDKAFDRLDNVDAASKEILVY